MSDGATALNDLSFLKLGWVKTQDQLNQVEAENIASAFRKHMRKRKNFLEKCVSENYLKQLHLDMFGHVWSWAGKWRKEETNIGVLPHQIFLQIRELCQDIQFWHRSNSELSLIERASILHHRLVRIHPFANGNGRHARLMADIYLYNFDHEIPKWPSNLHQIKSQYRKHYLKVLREADEGDYKPLLLFMKNLF